jgi:cellulose binding protein with CBM2 domain
MNTPFPPYYGYLLASKLAVKGATVGTLAVAQANVYGYSSKLPDGSYGVMLVNADPANAYTLSTSSLGITGSSLTRYGYSAASPTVTTATQAAGSVTVPAEGAVVLVSGSGNPVTTTTTTTTTTRPVTTTTTTRPVTTTTTTTRPVTTTTTTTRPVTTTTTRPVTTTTSRPVTTTTTTRPVTTTTTTRPVTTTTTAGGGTGSCTVTFSAPNPWSGGFVADVTVTANTPISSWKVTLTLPSGTTVANGWNAAFSGTNPVTAASLSYNGRLSAGQSASFGFQGAGSPAGTTVSCSGS